MNNTDSTITFRGLPWFKQTEDCYAFIGGAGGIGSWLSLFLSRTGISIRVQDFDTVETRNLGGQLYSRKDIGKRKVSALHEILVTFCPEKYPSMSTEIVDANTGVPKFAFSAFDNMRARKDMFEAWKNNFRNLSETEKNEAIFIDGRLEAEFFQIYCVTQDRISQYEETLVNDDQIPDTACSVKQTSHVAAMIGSFMTSFFTNHLTNIEEGQKVREVPFKYEVFLPLLTTYEE